MSKRKHTPGEWEGVIEGYKIKVFHGVVSIDGRELDFLDPFEVKINNILLRACLIASAPELLEALKEYELIFNEIAIEEIKGPAHIVLGINFTRKKGQQAIAKTEG